jgi:peptidoglycan/LPS O-acetylase OafA/YrhL
MPEARSNHFLVLRFVLASCVLLGHAPDLVDGDTHRELLTRAFHTLSLGALAVDGFFLLSGFLIVQSWCRDPRPLVFMQKRALRIAPAFWVASLVCALVVGPLASTSSWAGYFTQLHVGALVKSLVLFEPPGTPPVFAGQPYPYVNGSMWTIAYECRCYALVLALGVCGLAAKRWVWVALCVSSSLWWLAGPDVESVHVPLVVRALCKDPHQAARFLMLFTSGACFCVWRAQIPLRAWAAWLALALMGISLLHPVTAQLGVTTCGAYALFTFAFARVPALERFARAPDFSYGLYLYGWPVQKLWLWGVPTLSPWVLFPLSWIVSVALGALSWTLVEKPALAWKSRPSTR